MSTETTTRLDVADAKLDRLYGDNPPRDWDAICELTQIGMALATEVRALRERVDWLESSVDRNSPSARRARGLEPIRPAKRAR